MPARHEVQDIFVADAGKYVIGKAVFPSHMDQRELGGRFPQIFKALKFVIFRIFDSLHSGSFSIFQRDAPAAKFLKNLPISRSHACMSVIRSPEISGNSPVSCRTAQDAKHLLICAAAFPPEVQPVLLV
jgi:hypothetical protein